MALLRESRVAAHVARDPKLPTTIKLRVLARQQQLVRVDFEATPDHEVLKVALSRFEALLSEHDVVLLSDYAKGGLSHVTRMIELARAAGKPVLVDPKGSEWARYAGATVITPNRSELREVVGSWSDERELEDRITDLRHTLNIQHVLLTRSEEGMSLYNGGPVQHFPAVAREVYDVSGAGDTVIATLASCLAAGVRLEEGVRLANEAAGIVVGKLGTAAVSYNELFGE